MPNMVMAQDLDSTSTNNLIHLVANTMYTCVTLQSAHKALKLRGASTSPLIAEKMHSLHNKLRRHAINIVGKPKYVTREY